MKTNWMLSMVVAVSAIALGATPARSTDLRSMVATPLTGTLEIEQDIPVCDNLDFTVGVTGGRMEIAPAGGLDENGNKLFMLTRMNVTFQAFSTDVSCLGSHDHRDFTDVEASLGQAVTFTGVAMGGGLYNFTIPKEAFVVYQAAIQNGESDTSFRHPSQDVTGSVNLTSGAVHLLHVHVVTGIHIDIGCCIHEDKAGFLDANIDGTLAFPDSDGDGVPDNLDNCKFTPNPVQLPRPITPVLTVPPNITLLSCLDRGFGMATATDICSGLPVTVANDAPLVFARGPNTVTWSADDGVDPKLFAPQTVTIDDQTAPTILSTPPDFTINDCRAVSDQELGTPTGSDDCGGAVTFTNNKPPIFFAGPTNVTWTAHDAVGNTSTTTQTVTVVDTTPPTVSCVATNPTGNGFRVSASDHCDVPVIRLGTYVLAQGEVVQIQETGQAGVTLVNNISNDGLRHFQVGKGQAVITATDAANNVSSAVCGK